MDSDLLERKLRNIKISLIGAYTLNFILIGLVVWLVNSTNGTAQAAPDLTPIAVIDDATATATILPASLTPSLTATTAATEEPPTLTATNTLVATETLAPTTTPTMTPSNTPTQTATATNPPPTDPPPQPTAEAGPFWLRYVNLFRVQAGVQQLVENEAYSVGAIRHSEYMIRESASSHGEQLSSPFYSAAGAEAGQNGNIAISGWSGASDIWPIDYWLSATFHVVSMLDPHVREAGYGIYRDDNSSFKMTATFDVSLRREQGALPAGTTFPILFPADGGEMWVLEFKLPEWPDPMKSCQGISRPTGAPIVIQLGEGDIVPNVTSSTLLVDGEAVNHCVLDETRYFSDQAYEQQQGRSVLDSRDAIVILADSPYELGQTVEVTVVANGETINWTFETVEPPEDY